MVAHPWVSGQPATVPIVAAVFDLQASAHGLLYATSWETMGWHAEAGRHSNHAGVRGGHGHHRHRGQMGQRG